MISFFKEFKEFAVKGSMVELAVGVVIGAAFNGLVSSFVEDILMPPLGLLLGRVDFRDLFVNLGSGKFETLAEAEIAGVPTINYGLFINAFVGFFITAFAVYLLVRLINRLREDEAKDPSATPATRPCPYCIREVSKKASKCPFCTANIAPYTVGE